MKCWRFLALLVLATLTACDTASEHERLEQVSESAATSEPQYVGSEACAQCHAEAFAAWTGSHHAHSMMLPDEDSVLGDFAGGAEQLEGIRFGRADERFVVYEGDKRLPVAYTFGYEPLQQYLVETTGNRLQVLPYAADVRAGVRAQSSWIDLYPGEQLPPNDPLHWRGSLQNWNHMCADCHSTDLRKGFDLEADRFATAWAELNVGCEACHGPGSEHASASLGSNRPATLRPLDNQSEVEVCAQCHARRAQLAEGYGRGVHAFLDHYQPSLLDQGLYHPDGQVLDEVFVYGSFLQSRMYKAGVTCSDCHDAHAAGVNIGVNGTCTQCHQPDPPERFGQLIAKHYDSPAHHFHAQGSEGSQCISCHMPAKNFMQVDTRHDHSFRIPRPDLTETLGVPNTCNACHTDQTPQWAAAVLAERGVVPRADFAQIFAAAQANDLSVVDALAQIASDSTFAPIVRATALSLVADPEVPAAQSAISAGLQHAEPLIRLGALQAMRGVAESQRWWRVAPLLRDELLAIRLRAVELLAHRLNDAQPSPRLRPLARAYEEYVAAARLHGDRAESLSQLSVVQAAAGDVVAAREALDRALQHQPDSVVALLNLADLNRRTGQDGASGPLFERARAAAPEDSQVRLAEALWRSRQNDPNGALLGLHEAAALAPDDPHINYVLAIGLHSSGAVEEGVRRLQQNYARHPEHAQTVFALATTARDAGATDQARYYADRLLRRYPDNPTYAALVEQLRDGAL